jgi:hypothetical protein
MRDEGRDATLEEIKRRLMGYPPPRDPRLD